MAQGVRNRVDSAQTSRAARSSGPRRLLSTVRDSRGFRRFRRNRAAIVAAAVLVFLLLASFAGPLIYQVDPNRQVLQRALEGPSLDHPLGFDWLGRDLLSRTLYGGRISIALGIPVLAAATIIGTAIGVVSGYIGRIADQLIMALTDLWMAFPWFLLALLVISVLGPGLYQAMVAISISFVPRFIRLARASTLSTKELEYVLAARAIGQRPIAILSTHILLNISGAIAVQATLLTSVAVLAAAALGFLGLGVSAPTAEWGSMLSDGRNYMTISQHVVLAPGVAISIAVLAFNLVGDGLRDALDVRVSN